MIPNHEQFLEGIRLQKKVTVRFYSAADSGVIDRVCIPLDYGPGLENQDGLNRYWLWECATEGVGQMLGLVPKQIVDLRTLGDVFEPEKLGVKPWAWAIARDWAVPVVSLTQP